MTGEQRVLRWRVFRPAKADQFHLVELVNPDQTTCVFSVSSGLAPKARRERHVPERQSIAVEDLSAVQVGQRNLCRGNEEHVVPIHPVQVVLELGQLSGAGEGIAVHQQRWAHFDVAVLVCVQVDHEIGEGTYQPGPQAHEQRETGTRDARATLQIDNPQGFRQLPMWFGFEVELRHLAPGTHDDVVGLVALGHVGQRRVGNGEKDGLQFRLALSYVAVEHLDPIAGCLERCQKILGGLARLLATRHFLAGAIALGLEAFDFGQELTAVEVQLEDPVDGGTEGGIAPPEQLRAKGLRVLADALEVDHEMIKCRGGPAPGHGSRS